MMAHSLLYPLFRLVFGTLYPAYASYKAVRTKNIKEYVKWMMYWIVFALFTCAETFTDVFCSFWFPFYYEFKVILVLWLLSPATQGSSILYRKFVHPMLTKREQEIDEYIAKAKEQGYHTVLTLGSKGVNYATTVIMQTAIKGGGGLVNQLRRSYSLSDISADMEALAEMNRIKALPEDELDLGDTPMPIDPRLRRARGYSPRRSASGSGRVEMYFPEVDVNVRQRSTRPRETGIPLSHIRSNEDVSSGYSSAEMLYSGHPPTSEAQEPLVRTSSVGSSRVTRTKVSRGGAIPKRPATSEDNLSWSESEESDSGTQEEYFYDVPSSSPSEPVATLPSATPCQPVTPQPTEGDSKSIVPVALACELQDEREKNTECAESEQHSTTIEDQATLISLPENRERETVQMLMEPFPAEKENVEYEKDNKEELESVIREKITECADNVQHSSISPEQAAFVNLFTNQEERGTVQLIMEALQAEKDIVERFTHIKLTPSNDELLESDDKEAQCSDWETSSFSDAVSLPDVTDNALAGTVGSIPITVEWEESKTEESLVGNAPEESEFFDTENELTQNVVASTEVDIPAYTLDEIRNEDTSTESKGQKGVDEGWKDGRAGRYHKHPAPCPPPQPDAGLNTRDEKDGAEAKLIPEPADSDRKSPSPKRGSSVGKSPQPSPNIGKRNAADGITDGKSNEQVVQSVPFDKPVRAAYVEKLDVKPSGSDYGGPKVFASPNQKRKEPKQKNDSTIMSRLLSKPKNQLASFFPFLSSALTTSLTSLDGDLRAQDRARSSSIVGNTQSTSEYMSVPPELPPRRRTPDNVGQDGTRMNIREMSHSPPRRHAN